MGNIDECTPSPKAHAEFSASGSARWLACPGSIELSKKAPEQPESKYATEGTEAHACLEFMLKNRSKPKAARAMALKTYDDEMVEHAAATVAWVEARLAETPGALLITEERVDAAPFTCAGQFGTVDIAIVDEFGRLTVIDYKYGAGVVRNPEGDDGLGDSQLVYYALGLSYRFNHNFEDVELVVIQPRAYTDDGETIRSHVLSVDELLAWRQVFRNGVMATGEPKAKLASGKHCKFCPAAVLCPELKDNAMRQAQIVFSDAKGIEVLPDATLVALPNLSNMLKACDKLEAWIEKTRAHAMLVLERGGTVDGFKLVEKRAPRRWTDEEKTAKEAQKKYGSAAFTAPKLLSPAQYEKLFKDDGKWIEARVTIKSSGTTMVSENDKRPAVKSIQEVFATPPKALPSPKKESRKR